MKIVFLAILFALGLWTTNAFARENQTLKLVEKIPLPDVEGRIDHLAIDLKSKRLFVAAVDNNTVEVVDLEHKKVVQTIEGLSQPQGILFVPENNRLYVSNGGNGRCVIFDATSFAQEGVIEFNEDADNLRYDPRTHAVYTGYGNGGIGIVDVQKEKQIGSIALPAHPEAFEIDSQNDRIFINVPARKELIVASTKTLAVDTKWPVQAGGNYSLSFDETNRRLFIACRNPAELIVWNSESGKVVGEQEIDGDADDLFLDSDKKRLYVSCGSGFIDVIDSATLSTEKIMTRQGARTSLFVPETGLLYVAVPAAGSKSAEVWVYESG